MIIVYFIRHGQAGSRQNYDCLSGIGRQQAERLGNWFSRSGIRFDAAWSGCLVRQRETAELARQSALKSGAEFPEITTHGCWDEFDLDEVYRSIAPKIARHDEEFRRQYEELRRQARDIHSPVHRTWAKCDTTVIRAWVGAKYDFAGESFEAFVERVRAGGILFDRLDKSDGRDCHIAVFTSATPAAVWAAEALEVGGRKIMQLAGVTYNTAMTVIRRDRKRTWLLQFNSVPHLDAPELVTHR